MIHTTDSESPILILVVGVGSRVEVVGQVVGGEVHIGEEESALSERRGSASEAQHTGIVRSSKSTDDGEHGQMES